MTHEALDRRAFFRGLMATSAGLLVPRVVYSIAAPELIEAPGLALAELPLAIRNLLEDRTLERTFHDNLFPKIDFRTQQITVQQDWAEMDPDRVLRRMQQQLASEA